MFAYLDESIRRLLMERGGIDSASIDISFDMPTREWSAGISKPTVNLYLYNIRENLELREPNPWEYHPRPNNRAVKMKPDVRIDLCYSVTVFAQHIEDEHNTLHRVLTTFLRHPILPDEVLHDEYRGQEVRTFAAQPSIIMQSPADYWGAMDNDIKPSIDYRVTVRIDVNDAEEQLVPLTLTSHTSIGQKLNGNGAVGVEDLGYQIAGRVHRQGDDMQGVPNVSVTLLERGMTAVTTQSGEYGFSGIAEGTYNLAIRPEGQDERTVEITIPSGSYNIEI